MAKDYFEWIRQIQIAFDKLTPAISHYQKQIMMTNNALNPIVIEMSYQLNKISKILSPEVMKLNSIQLSMAQTIAELAKQQELLAESFRSYFTQWQPALERINHLACMSAAIPDTIYPYVDDLSTSITTAFTSEDLIENQTIETRQQPNEQIFINKLTWDKLLPIIISILIFLYTVYSDHQKSLIQQKQHEELVQKFDEFITAVERLVPDNSNDLGSKSPHNLNSE